MIEGLNEVLYHLLWTKDKVFDSVGKAIVPHTVIYQYFQPRFWYFTSIDGTIKKKSKEKLTEHYIQQEFLKKPSPSGIIAILFFIEDSKRKIEYLTTSQFISFVNDRKFHKDMILQKFVDPLGEFNVAYTVIWTNNFTLFEKKQNRLQLNNEKYDLYERAVTFDGKDYHVSTTPVRGTLLPNRLVKIADSIVSHVAAVTFEKMRIVRMILQLKLDPDDRIWMMCATNLRFFSDSKLPLDLNAEFEFPKEFNIKNLTVDTRNPAVFVKNTKCSNCLHFYEPTKVVEILYQDILQIYKENPTPIFNLHPKLSQADLERLRNNAQFMQKKAWMCFECYIETVGKGKDSNIQSLPLLGTGPLKPKWNKKDTKLISGIRKNSSIGQFTSRTSLAQLSIISPSSIASSLIHQNTFSTRTSKTAGGELLIGFPSPKV